MAWKKGQNLKQGHNLKEVCRSSIIHVRGIGRNMRRDVERDYFLV